MTRLLYFELYLNCIGMPLHLLYLPVDPRPLGRIWGRQKGSFAILSFHRLERLIAAPLLLVVYVFPLHALFYASNGYRKHFSKGSESTAR